MSYGRLPPFHWWRTVFFLIPAIALYTIVLGTVSLASAVVDPRGRVAHRCARLWSWLILATTGVRVRARGLDKLTPGRAYVFVSNHQSIYDIPVIFWSLPFDLRIIAKDALARFPFLGWHLRHTGHILVDRRHPQATIFKQITRLMREGLSLIVFPEGTRSMDGQVGRFKPGIFYLAIEARLSLVPITVVGSRHVMRKGRLMTCPGDVDLIVHEPVDTTGLSRDAARLLADQVRARIGVAANADDPSAGG